MADRNKKRGFDTMDEQKQREIARKGGQTSNSGRNQSQIPQDEETLLED